MAGWANAMLQLLQGERKLVIIDSFITQVMKRKIYVKLRHFIAKVFDKCWLNSNLCLFIYSRLLPGAKQSTVFFFKLTKGSYKPKADAQAKLKVKSRIRL